jgi:vacuolar-type H+-ATPase subunit C/Vma6
MVEFAYAVGRIRALEVHLLNESQILRLVDAKDFEAAYLVLRENPSYAEKLDHLENAFDFEGLLWADLISTLALLRYLAPDHPLLESLFKKYEPEMTLKKYLGLLKETAKQHPLPLFIKYAQGYILLNELKLELLMNGDFDPENILNRYRYTDYNRAVQAGLGSYQKTGSLFGLEREIDNHLMGLLQRAKYQAFGIEPLLGFFFAKEIEHKILRLILTAKQMKVKTEDIKERLRLPYV